MVEGEEAGMGVEKEIGIGNLGRSKTAIHQERKNRERCLVVEDN